MVGAAYAVDRKYFGEIGAYDEGMIVWGGENLEMSWRVSFCRLLLLIISHSHARACTHTHTPAFLLNLLFVHHILQY